MAPYSVIGKPVARPDGIDKVTGRGRYAADHPLPGTVWGKTLHSPYAHARIVSIDTSEARAVPGVYAVITGRDIAQGPWGRAIKDSPVLAVDRVRFFGERVAAVAAVDEDIAQRALDLITVEYEELPAVFDVLEAMSDSAPVLHPDFPGYPGGQPFAGLPTNAYSVAVNERGDLDAGFAEADLIVENTYTVPRQHQAYLEPHSVMIDASGETVQVWTCAKAPYDAVKALAVAIELPPEQVVLNHSYIGGDFGGKASPAILPVCYFLVEGGRPAGAHGERVHRRVHVGQPATLLRDQDKDRREARWHDHGPPHAVVHQLGRLRGLQAGGDHRRIAAGRDGGALQDRQRPA